MKKNGKPLIFGVTSETIPKTFYEFPTKQGKTRLKTKLIQQKNDRIQNKKHDKNI